MAAEEIIAKKHVKHIRPVAKLYEKTMRQVMGEEHYHLTTPQVLCEYELSTIKDLLTPTDEFGLPTADVTLKHDVDPSLIDGYVLQTEDTLEDYSFKKLVRAAFLAAALSLFVVCSVLWGYCL